MTTPFAATSYDFTEFVPARNYIAGAFHEASGDTVQDVVNPRFGQAMSHSLGERRGIHRLCHVLAPIDEALVKVALD